MEYYARFFLPGRVIRQGLVKLRFCAYFYEMLKKKYQVQHDGGVRRDKKYDKVAVFSRFFRFSPYDLCRYLTIIIIIDFFRFFFSIKCLVGDEHQSCPAPVNIAEDAYEQLKDAARELNLDWSAVDNVYRLDPVNSHYTLIKP